VIKPYLFKPCRHFIFLFTVFFISGCTTLKGPPNPDDPLESYNRSMFKFNQTVDKFTLKPIAEGYQYIMPEFASLGVSNFFNNLDDIVVFFNQLLQFKPGDAVETSARVVFNTTFGVLGLIDVSTVMNLPKHNEDFGQTLATWGVSSGPYIVLPLLGPSTIRNASGLVVDWTYFDPIFKRQTLRQSLITFSIKYIDKRANLLAATNIINEIAPDIYAFTRDAWLQHRKYVIYDGHPPDDELDNKDLFNNDLGGEVK